MNNSDLVSAVLYWIEFEILCARGQMLSESSLRNPIGQYLISAQDHHVEAEELYPDSFQPPGSGRRQSMDFCVKRRGGQNSWKAILETKWVNGKRVVDQEIFDDLLRLEAAKKARDQAEPFDRLFMIAGTPSAIEKRVFGRQLFSKMLPRKNGLRRIPVGAANEHGLKLWDAAAKRIRLKTLPSHMMVALVAKLRRPRRLDVWLWRVTSAAGRPQAR